MTLLGDDLTRPENYSELHQRRRIAARIAQCGGCGMCLNRDREVMAWGRSVCQMDQKRSYPLCLKDGRAPGFQLDKDQLVGKA